MSAVYSLSENFPSLMYVFISSTKNIANKFKFSFAGFVELFLTYLLFGIKLILFYVEVFNY